MKHTLLTIIAILSASVSLSAQVYRGGLIDKTIAIVGNEKITLNELESQIRDMRAMGYSTDRNARCEQLETMMENKLFLMQARIDSLEVNSSMVEEQLENHVNRVRTQLGGDEAVEDYFKKPLYRLRQEWKSMMEDMTLTQQEQSQIASSIAEITPYDVRVFMDTADVSSLPEIPIKYQLRQICIYPDRESAALAVKERLLEIRERIIGGEKFSTLARLYSEDPGSARKGGELGMASKAIFWPAFSDAAMSLKPGIISQIVETPDGFHLIEVIEKKGDMFNARHILMKPVYTSEDRDKAFSTLDSLKTEIGNGAVSFDMAASFYSQDPASRTNGGQVADLNTGSAYLEIDQLKPNDYRAIRNLKEGEISEPFETVDDEGRGNTIYKIIKVDKIIPAHPASMESDYSELIGYVRQTKQMEVIGKFIDDKIGSTYIVIDPLFAECEFSRAGWKDKIRKDD